MSASRRRMAVLAARSTRGPTRARPCAARGAAVVELASIGQAPIAVEQEEVGSAGGAVGSGHPLSRVEQEWKLPAFGKCQFAHVLGAVLRMAVEAVGVDGNYRDATFVVAREPSQLFSHMYDEGTVVADEHDEQCGGSVEVADGHFAAGHSVTQPEVRCAGAEAQHARRCFCHIYPEENAAAQCRRAVVTPRRRAR